MNALFLWYNWFISEEQVLYYALTDSYEAVNCGLIGFKVTSLKTLVIFNIKVTLILIDSYKLDDITKGLLTVKSSESSKAFSF